MATADTGQDSVVVSTGEAQLPRKSSRFNRFDSPWLNGKLLVGFALIAFIVLVGILGRIFWDTDLAFAASTPLSLPPAWEERGTWDYPLGTENSGRDMLALMIIGAPNSLMVGLVAAAIGVTVGIILGFTAGFVGGLADDIIRLLSDSVITIPVLLVLIVIQSVMREVTLFTMALIISLFAWPGPTRLIRSQVLSMRESGYVQMARLSGAPTWEIMFKEMMPNLLPYLAASFIGNSAGAILAAIGLEVLGLGPQRVPTLGVTIFFALESAAILRGMWWWWGFPTLILVNIFVGLLLINLGLDEIANPRLRKSNA
jgi:peptide/nickel transport system permease protein